MNKSLTSQLSLKYHEPERNQPCICGSNLKFKKCCASKYSSEAFIKFKEYYNSGNFENALIYARLHLTWYVLCYQAHTVLMVKFDRENAEPLLAIDIDSIAELLENLHLCYFQIGLSKDFPNVIENFSNLIDDKRWKIKISYILALWYLVDMEDQHLAFSAIKDVDFKSCQDYKLLELYLHVCPTPIPLDEFLDLVNRILKNTKSETCIIQLSLLKGVRLNFVGQTSEGNQIICDAIQRFMKLPEKTKTSSGKLVYAYALQFYGYFTDSLKYLQEAVNEVAILLLEAEKMKYHQSYQAELYKFLGDCEQAQGNHERAIQLYSKSLKYEPSDLTKILLTRSICNVDGVEKAREILNIINPDNLNNFEKFDIAISWAILSDISLNANDLKIAISKLKLAKSAEPYFIQMRDQLLIKLLETEPNLPLGKIANLFKRFNNYVTMNPSIFGFGININKIIEDIGNKNKK